MSVRSERDLPHSAAWARAAAAMFSSTTSQMPNAAVAVSMPRTRPTSVSTARAAAASSRRIVPPAKRSASRRPMTVSASVTVARVPPRP